MLQRIGDCNRNSRRSFVSRFIPILSDINIAACTHVPVLSLKGSLSKCLFNPAARRTATWLSIVIQQANLPAIYLLDHDNHDNHENVSEAAPPSG